MSTTDTEAPAMTTTQIHRIYIKAPREIVWNAVIDPDFTEQYLYGSRCDFDLRPGGSYRAVPGSAILAASEQMGMPMPDVMVDGEVIEVDPPAKLVHTFRMLMDPGLAAEGFTRVTWDLTEVNPDVTKVTITHELEGAPNLFTLVNGEMEHTGAGGGWLEVLSGLKTLLETGQPLHLH